MVKTKKKILGNQGISRDKKVGTLTTIPDFDVRTFIFNHILPLVCYKNDKNAFIAYYKQNI